MYFLVTKAQLSTPVLSTVGKILVFLYSAGCMEAGDLSTQSFNKPRSPYSPYRHAAPLEMTMAAGSIELFQRGINERSAALRSCHFDESGAEWRNLLSLMVHEA